jgi:hypothetical protein
MEPEHIVLALKILHPPPLHLVISAPTLTSDPWCQLTSLVTDKKLHASVTHMETMFSSHVMQFLATAKGTSTGPGSDSTSRMNFFGAVSKSHTVHKAGIHLILDNKCLACHLTHIHFASSVHEISLQSLCVFKTSGGKNFIQ